MTAMFDAVTVVLRLAMLLLTTGLLAMDRPATALVAVLLLTMILLAMVRLAMFLVTTMVLLMTLRLAMRVLPAMLRWARTTRLLARTDQRPTPMPA